MNPQDDTTAVPTEPQPVSPSHSTQTLIYEGENRADAPRYLFIVGQRRHFRITDPRITIGSSHTCDLVLQDPTVSRLHCTVKRTADRLLVCDEGSKNGVYLNGARVRSAELVAGATLVLGRTTIRATRTSSAAKDGGRKVVFCDMVTQDPAMVEVFHQLDRLASTNLSVFLHGESGTGKELAARAIHTLSPRSSGSWIPLNCGALPPEILEAELFGYEKGAFTGADRSKPGVFEAAHGGTLFLDEIAELPLEQQPALLRVLDSGKIRRVGSNRLRTVSVRIVSASNKDLAHLVRIGRFRGDLFYRLAEADVTLPPLRQRPADIPLLVRHFLDRMPRSGSPAEPPPWAHRRLETHDWPGNVRELSNLVRRAAALGWQTALEKIPTEPKPADPAPARPPVYVPAGNSDDTCPVIPMVRACPAAAEPRVRYSTPDPARAAKRGQGEDPSSSGTPDRQGDPIRPPDDPSILSPLPDDDTKSDLDLPPSPLQPPIRFHGCTFAEVEARMVQQALDQTMGNQTEAARLLGMKRSTFRLRLKRHGV